MNAITTKSLAITALVALLGAASLAFMQTEPAAPRQEVLKFERVVIEGKRAVATQTADIVKLPRVVIEGRHHDTMQLAKANHCSATVSC
ncbi:MAG: hypothetical protein JO006_15000 [Paucibacter sp.]|nr:hypothetical protein [Roseateles sp.]